MASLYIHIPFCKQACHYCDFHFSTSVKKKPMLVKALCKELVMRKEEIGDTLDTIYFGGGTPSLLSIEELQIIFETINNHFRLSENIEITLEANPDDLTTQVVKNLASSPINRLSIGVQSFYEEDLRLMNRAHNADEAYEALHLAKHYFNNISLDLIYGVPGMSVKRWATNLDKALALNIPHLSCYALTVEENTALERFIQKGKVAPVNDALARLHYEVLLEKTEAAGYVNYEFSNFGKAGYFSQNNTAYWTGKPYLGIGPAAHSYDGSQRSWNVRNNTLYIKSIEANSLPVEREQLTLRDKYNEYMMTSLRTQWGVHLAYVEEEYGVNFKKHMLAQAQPHLLNELLILEGDILKISSKGKFLSDGIASDLFKV